MRFQFQESLIWEGNNTTVDPDGKVCVVKGKSEPKARRQLPKPRIGRVWILVLKWSGER